MIVLGEGSDPLNHLLHVLLLGAVVDLQDALVVVHGDLDPLGDALQQTLVQ